MQAKHACCAVYTSVCTSNVDSVERIEEEEGNHLTGTSLAGFTG